MHICNTESIDTQTKHDLHHLPRRAPLISLHHFVLVLLLLLLLLILRGLDNKISLLPDRMH